MLVVLEQWDTVKNPRALVRLVAKRALYRGWETTHRAEQAEARIRQHEFVADFDANEDRAHAMELLKALPAAQREVFVATIDGHTPGEIAEFTGQESSTVRSNLRHARDKIADALDATSTRKEATDGP